MLSRIKAYAAGDLWRVRVRDLSRMKSFLITLLRILVLSFRGLAEDRLQLRASALTFYSVISVVPLVAMAFSIAKGFGFERALERLVRDRLEGQEQVVTKILGFANSLIESVTGGMIAGVGVMVLFWTVLKVLGNVESAFNDIWGVKKGRSIGRKVSDYLSLMLIGPILFVLSSAATVVISAEVKLVFSKISLLGALRPLVLSGLAILPYVSIWGLFVFMYMFIPNTKVRFASSLIAGIIAGTLFQGFERVYIHSQITVAKFNAVYGSFAALPLFLVWLQGSWLIVLFGAEIAFSHQNVETYEFEPDCLYISERRRRLLSLLVMHALVKSFSAGQGPLSESEVSHRLEIPIRLVREILHRLMLATLISQTPGKLGEMAYQPAKKTEDVTVASVVKALDGQGNEGLPVAPSEAYDAISLTLEAFGRLVEMSPENLRLESL